MSLNIEKHRVVKKVREERVKRDYVKIHNDKELQALRIERMMENPVRINARGEGSLRSPAPLRTAPFIFVISASQRRRQALLEVSGQSEASDS